MKLFLALLCFLKFSESRSTQGCICKQAGEQLNSVVKSLVRDDYEHDETYQLTHAVKQDTCTKDAHSCERLSQVTQLQHRKLRAMLPQPASSTVEAMTVYVELIAKLNDQLVQAISKATAAETRKTSAHKVVKSLRTLKHDLELSVESWKKCTCSTQPVVKKPVYRVLITGVYSPKELFYAALRCAHLLQATVKQDLYTRREKYKCN